MDYRNELAHTRSNVSANRSLFVVKQLFKIGLEEGSITEDVAGNIRYLSEKEHSRISFCFLPNGRPHKSMREHESQVLHASAHCFGLRTWCLQARSSFPLLGDIDSDDEGVGLRTFYRTKNGARRTQHLMPRTGNTF